MNTAELKLDLIQQITNLTDGAKLRELIQFVRFQSDKSIHTTTEEEKQAIIEAKNQIANGEVIANEDMQKEINEWLGK